MTIPDTISTEMIPKDESLIIMTGYGLMIRGKKTAADINKAIFCDHHSGGELPKYSKKAETTI